MASGDIEHSELPDNLLHEPKGASTAAKGTVYIADGAGSGSFQKVPVSSFSMTIPSISNAVLTDIEDTITVSGSTLSQAINGTLNDIQAVVGIPQEMTNGINKNTAEIYNLYLNLKEINDVVKADIAALQTKQNEIITKLKSIGLMND